MRHPIRLKARLRRFLGPAKAGWTARELPSMQLELSFGTVYEPVTR